MNGVVTFRAGKITVDEALVIEGDVGSKTGNIYHDGAVIVRGTIQEGFGVKATKDISINSPMGIHLVDIESAHGDILIKGGVSQSTVKAQQGTVFTKYANESTIEARDTINIGIYAIGGQLDANQIVVQSDKGQIIGGVVKATASVSSPFIGNERGVKTTVLIQGFDREALVKRKDGLQLESERLTRRIDQMTGLVDTMGSKAGPSNMEVSEEVDRITESRDDMKETLARTKQELENLGFLKTVKGNGQVRITQCAYPNTYIELAGIQSTIHSPTKGTLYIKERAVCHDMET